MKQGARSWWLKEQQQQLYPYLLRIALDVLLIPAMSAALEQLFSLANITILDCCNQIYGKTTEAIKCLKS